MNPAAERTSAREWRRRWALRGALWLLALIGLWPRLLEITLRVERDSNEGWNAVWADRIAHGDPIYFGGSSLLANNYPPLSFHLLALFPDPLIAGRVAALCGLLATAAGIGWIVRRTGGEGVAAAGLLVAFMGAHHSGYVAMNDPQWLGHAVMTAGLVVLVAGRARAVSIVAAAALMLAAGLIKHSLLPLPLAVTWWLWRERGRELGWWLGSAATAASLGLLWMRTAHGTDCLSSIVGTPRGYSWWAGGRSLLRWSVVGLPLLAVAWMGLRSGVDDRWARLVRAYLGFAAVWAAVTIGGDGVDRNVYFDLIIAGVIAAGWALARVDTRGWTGWAAVAVLPIAVVVPTLWTEAARTAARVAENEADIAWLRAQAGPVAGLRLDLVHWSGHRVEVETFNLSQRLAAGSLDPKRVTDAPINVWQLPPGREWPLAAGPARDAWLSAFATARTSGNGVFLVRRADRRP